MKQQLLLASILILAVASVSVRAECIDGKLEKSSNSEESDVSLFFKNVGCTIQKGAMTVQEGAKKLGGEIKEGAKKFKESAKKFGSDVKTKFGELKDKMSTSSEESSPPTHSLLSNVELINPDVLKAEQKCGRGFILDALGDCKKN